MNVLWWIIIGLIAGLIARMLVPGQDRLGILGTIALGMIGSVVGGFLVTLVRTGHGRFSTAGLLGSIVGAILVLVGFRNVFERRGRVLGRRGLL